jgi:signal transduction histidine kinase
LEINHLGADSGKVNTQSVQLPQFLKEMANFGSVLADAKQIAFEYVGGAELPAEARFDRHKLQRVLDNLFTNAVKYSTRGRKVTFTVAASSGRLNFAVRDQGLGIPLSEQPLLFREFGKTSVRPTEGETSTGLGLAIAKKIVQQLGGEIKATSEVGKGSEFSFWIPLQ